MAWNNIIGQQRVKKILQKAYVENRISHSYCFWGEEGIGKEAVAIEFAKLLNCKNPKINQNSAEACDECSSCQKANSLQHPNIELIFSLPTGKSIENLNNPEGKDDEELIDLIRNELKLKSNDFYHKITLPNANQIRINSIRELKKKLSLSQIQSGRRCIIILDADQMTTEASNAFLKSLEEPNPDITFILVTSRRQAMLSTILSRCQKLKFDPISDNDMIETLCSRYEQNLEEARLINQFARGSLTQAMDYLDSDMKAMRENVVRVLRLALKKKNFRDELFDHIEPLIKGNDKHSIEIFIYLIILWFRDAFTTFQTKSTKNVINLDQIETINRFAQNFGAKNIIECIEISEKHFSQIRKNVQPQLILISLLLNLRRILLD